MIIQSPNTRKMGHTLLWLPTEISQEINLYAILVRGVKRALRLRLVCSESLLYIAIGLILSRDCSYK